VSDIIIANNLFKDASMPTAGDHGANNVISIGNGGNGTITYGKWGDSVDVIVDYNTVHASSASWTTAQQYNGTVYSWADFKTASGTSASPATATTDPGLDASYKPQSTSPYKQAGVDLSAYITTDIDGVARSLWSIGAYEYGGGATIWTVTASTTSPCSVSPASQAIADGQTFNVDFICDGYKPGETTGYSETWVKTGTNTWRLSGTATVDITIDVTPQLRVYSGRQ
jgi:hypothetical protein